MDKIAFAIAAVLLVSSCNSVKPAKTFFESQIFEAIENISMEKLSESRGKLVHKINGSNATAAFVNFLIDERLNNFDGLKKRLSNLQDWIDEGYITPIDHEFEIALGDIYLGRAYLKINQLENAKKILKKMNHTLQDFVNSVENVGPIESARKFVGKEIYFKNAHFFNFAIGVYESQINSKTLSENTYLSYWTQTSIGISPYFESQRNFLEVMITFRLENSNYLFDETLNSKVSKNLFYEYLRVGIMSVEDFKNLGKNLNREKLPVGLQSFIDQLPAAQSEKN